MIRECKTVDMTALIDVIAGRGNPPVTRHGVAMGYKVLNQLAEILDLPMDCFGVDIRIRIDEAVYIAVHRRCAIKPTEEKQ